MGLGSTEKIVLTPFLWGGGGLRGKQGCSKRRSPFKRIRHTHNCSIHPHRRNLPKSCIFCTFAYAGPVFFAQALFPHEPTHLLPLGGGHFGSNFD
jgi:hypothetical protein